MKYIYIYYLEIATVNGKKIDNIIMYNYSVMSRGTSYVMCVKNVLLYVYNYMHIRSLLALPA